MSFISQIFSFARSKGLAGPTRRYVLEGQLEGHRNGIYVMSAVSNGTLLATGGESGLKIYDLRDMHQIKPPSQMSNTLMQITAVRWITGSEDPWEVLCFGDVRGNVTVWRQNIRMCCFEEIASHRLGNGYEILSIGSDRTQRCTFRIAIGHRDQIVQVWNLDADSNNGSSSFIALYSIRLDKSIPISTLFYGPSNDSLTPRKLHILGANDGMMIRLHERTGEVLMSREISRQIGMASVMEEDNVIVLDNTVNGFDLHSFDTGSYIRTFPTALTAKDRRTPRHVCFGENGYIVVGGDNDGKIYIFDRRSGATLDTLQHSPATRGSQTVTSFTRDGVHYIASASSEEQDDSQIYLWKYAPPPSHADRRGFKHRSRICEARFPFGLKQALALGFCVLAFLGLDIWWPTVLHIFVNKPITFIKTHPNPIERIWTFQRELWRCIRPPHMENYRFTYPSQPPPTPTIMDHSNPPLTPTNPNIRLTENSDISQVLLESILQSMLAKIEHSQPFTVANPVSNQAATVANLESTSTASSDSTQMFIPDLLIH